MLHLPSLKFNTPKALPEAELDRMVAQIEKEKQMQSLIPQGFHGICQTPYKGKVLRHCEANYKLLTGWLHEDQGEVLGVVWFLKVLQEHPRYEAQLVWESADVLDPKKRSQIGQDALAESRKVFSEGARQIKEFGDNEANFRFVCSVLGNSFNAYQLDQAYLAGALKGLAPVSSSELETWRQERIAQENEFLKKDQITQQEQAQAKEIRQRRFAENRRSAVEEELHRRLVLGYERDVVYGNKKHPLPFDWSGQRLDAAFIKKCDLQTMKILVARFGDAQLTARLQGVTHASAVIDRGDGKGPRTVEVEFL
jgi:hypothetical protein